MEDSIYEKAKRVLTAASVDGKTVDITTAASLVAASLMAQHTQRATKEAMIHEKTKTVLALAGHALANPSIPQGAAVGSAVSVFYDVMNWAAEDAKGK